MSKIWKRGLAILLALVMAGGITALPAGAAVYERTDAAEAPADIAEPMRSEEKEAVLPEAGGAVLPEKLPRVTDPVPEGAGNRTLPDIGAAQSGKDGALSWSFSGGTLTITGKGAMEDRDGEEEYAWSGLAGKANKLVIGEGVTSTGTYAFYHFNVLTDISLPSTLKTIGAVSFADCTALTAVSVPGKVTSIGRFAFSSCENLASVTGCAGVTTIGDDAFQNAALTSFKIPSKLETLAADAFHNCNAMTAFTGGSPAYSVKDGVVYTDGGKTLAFFPGGRGGSFTVPSGVTKIGEDAFWSNRVLKSVTFSSSVKEVGQEAFYICEALENVTFGTGMRIIGTKAFCYSAVKKLDLKKTQKIGFNAFYDCDGLTSLTVPASVTEMEFGCFESCSNLEKLVLKPSCISIPERAFADCFSLSDLTLGEGLVFIMEEAFRCGGACELKNVTLPKSLLSCVDGAFPKDTAIKTVRSMTQYGENGYVVQEEVRVTLETSYTKAFEVLKYVNQARKEEGLGILYMDADLLEAAMQRAAETAVLYCHTRPNSLRPWSITGKIKAENIAVNQKTAKTVVEEWLSSPGHREAVLDANATSIGVGCVIADGSIWDMPFWVQEFGKNEISRDCARPKDGDRTYTIGIFPAEFTIYNSFGDTVDPLRGLAFEGGEDGAITLNVKESRTVGLRIVNYRWDYMDVKLENGGFAWGSRDSSVVTVTAAGKLTGRGPGRTEVYVKFPDREKITKEVAVRLPFTDVPEDASYYDAVAWAYRKGIVKGKSATLFAPSDSLTRGEFCTMLWRMWGKPGVSQKAEAAFPFADARKSNHYKAILWCYSKGIINGYKEDGQQVFRPARTITRGNILVMLFKLAKQEPGYKAPTVKNPFTDVPDGNKNLSAYRWAYENRVTTAKKLQPGVACKRSAMVSFLYGYDRAYRAAE